MEHRSWAWHDLIANLGTLTLNEVWLPVASGKTFQMLARPTTSQEQVFALLGVPTPCPVTDHLR
jgi:hypothetical protein